MPGTGTGRVWGLSWVGSGAFPNLAVSTKMRSVFGSYAMVFAPNSVFTFPASIRKRG